MDQQLELFPNHGFIDKSLLVSIKIQQCAQGEKSKIDHDQYHTEAEHVHLCFPKIAAGQVFLHHVLIQTRHDERYEGSTQKLHEEILGTAFPKENLAVTAC